MANDGAEDVKSGLLSASPPSVYIRRRDESAPTKAPECVKTSTTQLCLVRSGFPAESVYALQCAFVFIISVRLFFVTLSSQSRDVMIRDEIGLTGGRHPLDLIQSGAPPNLVGFTFLFIFKLKLHE